MNGPRVVWILWEIYFHFQRQRQKSVCQIKTKFGMEIAGAFKTGATNKSPQTLCAIERLFSTFFLGVWRIIIELVKLYKLALYEMKFSNVIFESYAQADAHFSQSESICRRFDCFTRKKTVFVFSFAFSSPSADKAFHFEIYWTILPICEQTFSCGQFVPPLHPDVSLRFKLRTDHLWNCLRYSFLIIPFAPIDSRPEWGNFCCGS